MVDLHTHILPGIDDGVDTADEAVAFARMAYEDGTRTIVATPHCKEGFYENDRATVVADTAKLNTRLQTEGIGITVLPGAEVHICPDLVERIADGRAPTVADNGKTLLLELSLTQYPVELTNLIFQLKLAGLQIVLAHPERIKYFQDDPDRYEEVVRLGAWGQITTGSVLGVFGNTAAEFSEELLRKGLVHVLSSDAHNVRGRPPRMRSAMEAMVPFVGEARAEAMVTTAPQALVEGLPPELPPAPEGTGRKRGFLSRLFGTD